MNVTVNSANDISERYPLLSALAELGIRAKLSPTDTILLAPSALVTPHVKRTVAQLKSDLLAELRAWTAAQEDQADPYASLPVAQTAPQTALQTALVVIADPRPDLADDSALWTRLLRRAESVDENLAGTLHGFRCCGARLERAVTGYRIARGSEWWADGAAFRADYAKWIFGGTEDVAARERIGIAALLNDLN